MTTDTLHGRKIAFPAVKALAELFPVIRPADGPAPLLATWKSWEAGTWSDRAGRTRSYLRGSLRVRDDSYRTYHVQASAELLADLEANMLHCSNDTVTFEVIPWDDGRALVLAQHGQIIGSRYLAIIDAASIPAA